MALHIISNKPTASWRWEHYGVGVIFRMFLAGFIQMNKGKMNELVRVDANLM